MNKKIIFWIVLFLVLVGAGYFINRKYFTKSEMEISESPLASPSSSVSLTPSLSVTASTLASPKATDLPTSYIIDNFPFASQAPLANWDELHDEACEEASVILVKWWQDNKSTISAQTMDQEILKMVDWEIKNWGEHKDLTVKETAQMASSFYSLDLTPQYNITIDSIKKEISQDHPVILPTAGRLLGNPNFRSPGPIYHMLVAIGYNGKNIITQDVGTRNGNHYTYNQEIFFNAIHDWNGSPDNIQSGRKAMLVLE